MNDIKKLHLANLPTPIERLERTSKALGVNLYVKRDDFTGIELSGNKVRKLEFALAEALAQGAQTLITCGGIQSNHARATAAAARKLGLGVHLVLRSEDSPLLEGNYLLDCLLDAQVTFIPAETFSDTYEAVMASLKDTYDKQGKPAYILPIGASNAIGNFGYCNAFQEILDQEKKMNVTFDTIVCTVGSGGTYGGLLLGKLINHSDKRILGFNISSTASAFQIEIAKIVNDSLALLDLSPVVHPENIDIIDGYAGRGYALSTPEEIEFIKSIARSEGLILDPVYTGKAFRGLLSELQQGHIDTQNILFIHTGGLMGFVPDYLKY